MYNEGDGAEQTFEISLFFWLHLTAEQGTSSNPTSLGMTKKQAKLPLRSLETKDRTLSHKSSKVGIAKSRVVIFCGNRHNMLICGVCCNFGSFTVRNGGKINFVHL